jgi:hypothetical protein
VAQNYAGWLAMVEIPITSLAPHFSQEHVIFGCHYMLEFEWIEREHYWVLHLYDASGGPIALGLKIKLDGPIFEDRATKLVLLLLPKHPQAQLNLGSFHIDFILVAYEAV